jgi:hypothetical protein
MAKADGAKRKGWIRPKWVALLLVVLGVFAAVETGWMGFGLAALRSVVFPRDEALLEWVPADTLAVVIVDPHRIRPGGLGSAQGFVRENLDRVRANIKKATGVDLGFDVDKLALTPTLAVLRGRFDEGKITDRLAEYKYAKSEYKGQRYLVRTGEDALFVSSDAIIVYGQEAAIKASIDANVGVSLARNESVTARLSEIGWDEPVLGTIELASDRPSLRAMIAGVSGPRAVTAGIREAQGLDVTAIVETASPSGAGDLAKFLEEHRSDATQSLGAMANTDFGRSLADIAKGAAIQPDTTHGRVTLRTHLSGDALSTLLRTAQTSVPLQEMVKTLQIIQFLAPGS